MRRRSLLMVSVFAVISLVGPVASAEAAPSVSKAESDAKRMANDSRAENGLKPLRWNAELRDIARKHSQWMARNDRLKHNKNLGKQVGPHRSLGENVGVGRSIQVLHGAFMNSSGHRGNLLGPTPIAGFGVAVLDGDIWITQIFLTPK